MLKILDLVKTTEERVKRTDTKNNRTHSSKNDNSLFNQFVQWQCKWYVGKKKIDVRMDWMREKKDRFVDVELNVENCWQNHKEKWFVIIIMTYSLRCHHCLPLPIALGQCLVQSVPNVHRNEHYFNFIYHLNQKHW